MAGSDNEPFGVYRPIPIVWFAAAVMGQALVLAFLFVIPVVFLRAHPVLIMAAGALWTAYLLFRLWPRKLAGASVAWRAATLTALGLQFALFVLGCLTPPACKDVYQWPTAACLAEGEAVSP